MISRNWTGVVRPGMADAYVQHLARETLRHLAGIDGFVSASVLKRAVVDGTEFRVVTLWTSLAAIEAFAGSDTEAAVVPAAAQALMVRFDTRATHYEVVALQ